MRSILFKQACQILNYVALPIALGLLTAVLYLQYKNTPTQTAQSQNTAGDSMVIHPVKTEKAPHSYADAVQQAIPSVVNIYTRTRIITQEPTAGNPLSHYFYNFPERERIQSSLGSGVIVNTNGYLLTNYHVINGADEIIVLLNDGRESLAKFIGSDPEIDLAVLKIDLTDLKAITFGDVDSARVGDVVLAIGNPYGIGQTVTQGIISASSRDGLSMATNYLQTDAAINPGNSGGALIDADGKLLGINTSILNKTGASIGIGFAIPVDTALKVLDDVTRHGRVVRGALGIVTKAVPPLLSQIFGLESGKGLLITAIYENGPAHLAGLLPGDIIIEIDKNAIMGNESGIDVISKSIPGKEVKIVFLRQGKKISRDITPAAREK